MCPLVLGGHPELGRGLLRRGARSPGCPRAWKEVVSIHREGREVTAATAGQEADAVCGHPESTFSQPGQLKARVTALL